MSETLTNILSLAAIAISVATAIAMVIVNARHDTAMYKRKIYVQRRIDTITQYMSATAAYLNNPRQSHLSEYSHAYGEAVLYVSADTRAMMRNLNENIAGYSGDIDRANSIWHVLIPPMSEEIERIKAGESA
jgi:hypothetical protein